MRFLHRNLHFILPLAVLAAAVFLRADEPWLVEQARLSVFDNYQRLKPRVYDPASPVRIVDIDDESLARLGQWPWPRTLLAGLVDRLGAAGVVTIAFDAVFAEPDRTSPQRLLELWTDAGAADAVRARIAKLPDNDQVFADALGRVNAVTGFVLTNSVHGRAPELKAGFAFAGDDPEPFVLAYTGAVVNLPAIAAAAAGNGSITGLPDRDGIIRRTPLVFRLDEKIYPSLVVEALRVAQDASTYIIKSSGASGVYSFGERTGISQIKVGNFPIPTDAYGRVWIHYAGTQAARFVPAWRVMQPDFDASEVAGRIIFIGTTAAGLKDLRTTPLNPTAAGVEVFAELLEQILAKDFLERPHFALGLELVYLVALGLLLIVLVPRVGARWCAFVATAAIASAVFGSWHAYTRWHWLLDPVFPSMAVLAVYIVQTGIIFLRTETERRWVRNAFGRYISPAVVSRLAEHPERLALGGEMREMTVMFSDIRDFTARSERLDAQGLTRFINRYLTPMTECVLTNQGTVDKYIGDCVMAFWNAPLDDADHRRHACRTALAMRARLAGLNESWAAEAQAAGETFDPMRIGIGLNTGLCCVGNMGSDQRFDYSVLGDDVNLASRLEGQSKVYGVDIIASEAALAGVEGFASLEIDLIRVKGKARPVRIFHLAGDQAHAASDAFMRLSAAHGDMLRAYCARNWDAADAALARCRASVAPTLAPLYNLYAQRIAVFRVQPPAAGWDGVHDAAEK
ncbi:MAG: adenylate/guanylate cyclase domain-containing protein [Alphaproteobacteria bacterium]|nr:adenylate/guanylate cyclase domain-containing protein [Alphaproteobacteria bacterium]